MAIAKVELVCEVCGEKFVHKKEFGTRREADNWEEYMDGRNGICPDCYKASKQAERENAKATFIKDVYSKLGLPTIVGVSEKQINYAENLRIKYYQFREKNKGSRLLGNTDELEKLLQTEAEARKIIDALLSANRNFRI